jgi:hypothetical protein
MIAATRSQSQPCHRCGNAPCCTLTVAVTAALTNPQSHALSHSLLLQAPLTTVLLSCIPAHPSCPLLPAVVMEAASTPILLTTLGLSARPNRAACAVAGWCAEGWLLRDPRLVAQAAGAMTTALRNFCEHLPISMLRWLLYIFTLSHL